jgi:hypothetical protein
VRPLAVPWAGRIPRARAAKSGQLTKYLEPVPVPGAGIVVATPSRPNTYSFTQTEITRQLHPELPPTPLWAYDDGSGLTGQFGSFGIAVVGRSGTPLSVSYTNGLPDTYPDWIPVDTRLTPLGREVRLMSHLHGGFVAADSDGNPAFTPNGFGRGETQSVFYTNQLPQMPASLLWFHDHGLGATRLNVLAGLAAAYLLGRVRYRRGAQPDRNPRRRLQGHCQGKPGIPHDHPGQARATNGCDGAPEVCLPLPHRRARGQRHDAAVHGHALTQGKNGRFPSGSFWRLGPNGIHS